ncbi:MAG TPA: M1 family aminopeptidase [Chitinophagaceae bacterium]|nr:M1 family aminopeptidase [Chitinophagaceae bacterium]HQX74283.1 M1 family aminopeptidase [Chitinophagaceae bacterium]
MKKVLFTLLLILPGFVLLAQTKPSADTAWKKEYRETATKINNLVHTKLDVKPDFSKSYLYGKAWLTLKPHFYSTDSLTLDAKGMEFKKIALLKGNQQVPLKYEYDDWQLRIKLDKSYKAGESYTIYIDYIAKPDEFEEKYAKGAMLGIKGMYFINPKGEEKDKPTQIWTQGETESSSAWFPTIDKTNQKTTQELTVTVDNKYVTLSNGKLVSQKKNKDGTRSDYWKMDLPHAPYLFFLGVGEYAVIKDSWRGKEVNYYVEKEYASVAKKIFGNTPEMMTFFSKITGVDYPWIKYSQITGRDYVAGAMENTTATIHQESAQQDARELVDGNNWEGTIAHELFHQWFGDYVTTESWSNLTVNESFADYSQTLWDEYKYGKDAGDAENFNGMQGYLMSGSENKQLVRFHYKDKEDMFDAVSYQKGGRILHMLRNYVGDSAFFKSLNNYLTTNKFKSAEAHQLRLAFEDVTGRDLNWFFNQWYFNSGHPSVDIDYQYDDAAGKVNVIIKQTQKSGKIFSLPLAIDVYDGANKKRYIVWVKNGVDIFTISYAKRPDLVNVDGDKVILWVKKDNKTLDNYIHQYTHAGNYLDRREAIDFASKKLDDPKAVELIKTALTDKYHGLRNFAISKADLKKETVKTGFESVLLNLAKSDKYATVRASAIQKLGDYKKAEYADLFKKAVTDSSYTVAGNALAALIKVDPATSSALVKQLAEKPSKGILQEVVMSEILKSGDESMAEKIIGDFAKMPLSQGKFQALNGLATYLSAIKNAEKIKWGVDEIVKFRDAIPENFKNQTDPFINGMVLKGILADKTKKAKENAADTALQELVEYIKAKLPEADKKGF